MNRIASPVVEVKVFLLKSLVDFNYSNQSNYLVYMSLSKVLSSSKSKMWERRGTLKQLNVAGGKGANEHSLRMGRKNPLILMTTSRRASLLRES
jgi:hypothetical protein